MNKLYKICKNCNSDFITTTGRTMCSDKCLDEFRNKPIISRLNLIHPDLFLVSIDKNRTHIFCRDEYGIVRLNVAYHIRNKKQNYTIKSAVDKVSYWRNVAINVHGNKYDYSKSIYISNKKKVTIICKIHGEFYQAPQDHIDKKCGCPKCGKDLNFGSYHIKLAEKNIEKFKLIPAVVYIIKCYNINESFFKIGITKNKPSYRTNTIPYECKILHLIKTNLLNAIFIERSLHSKLVKYRYNPKIYFAGHTECFSNIDRLHHERYRKI